MGLLVRFGDREGGLRKGLLLDGAALCAGSGGDLGEALRVVAGVRVGVMMVVGNAGVSGRRHSGRVMHGRLGWESGGDARDAGTRKPAGHASGGLGCGGVCRKQARQVMWARPWCQQVSQSSARSGGGDSAKSSFAYISPSNSQKRSSPPPLAPYHDGSPWGR